MLVQINEKINETKNKKTKKLEVSAGTRTCNSLPSLSGMFMYLTIRGNLYMWSIYTGELVLWLKPVSYHHHLGTDLLTPSATTE